MKYFFILFLSILSFGSVCAQGYTQAVGLRVGWISPGFEYRYYTSDEHSFRALLATRDRGLQVHALTEYHQYDLFSFSYQLVFFYGAGVHLGFESWDQPKDENGRDGETRSAFLAGADGVMGLEYTFQGAPVKTGVEVKPYLDIFGRDGLAIFIPDFAFTVKYLF